MSLQHEFDHRFLAEALLDLLDDHLLPRELLEQVRLILEVAKNLAFSAHTHFDSREELTEDLAFGIPVRIASKVKRIKRDVESGMSHVRV